MTDETDHKMNWTEAFEGLGLLIIILAVLAVIVWWHWFDSRSLADKLHQQLSESIKAACERKILK